MTKKCIYLLGVVYVSILISAFSYTHSKKNQLRTIVLDAGHGGKDPGAPCWSNGCDEGDITLAIVLKLGKEIEKLVPGIEVLYTRKDNSYPSLHYRADFANEKKADLFLSVHCNSRDPIYKKEPDGTKTVTYYEGKGKKKKKLTKQVTVYKTVKYHNPVKGMETYVWIPGKNEQKTDAVAARENAEIFKDPDYKTKYGDGLDINSAEFIAKAKLRTKKYFLRSNMLANFVQEEGAAAGRNDRNVLQRGVGIWVLQATAMPSVLVETGYISNPEEEKYLNSTAGQQEMASIIAKAVKKYKEELDKTAGGTNAKNNLFNNRPNNSMAWYTKPDEITINSIHTTINS
jgi:N-acetylmuramoyl-L-alanine amidase